MMDAAGWFDGVGNGTPPCVREGYLHPAYRITIRCVNDDYAIVKCGLSAVWSGIELLWEQGRAKKSGKVPQVAAKLLQTLMGLLSRD